MRLAVLLVAASGLLALVAVAPAGASATVAPACEGVVTGPRASCQISCRAFEPGGTFVAATGEGVTADYGVDARIGITGCGVSYSCYLDYVASYGPVYRVCAWYVSYASTGSLTCWAEEYAGTFSCAATPL